MIRQRPQPDALAQGEESFRQRAHVDIFADFFDVNSQAMFTADCDQRHTC